MRVSRRAVVALALAAIALAVGGAAWARGRARRYDWIDGPLVRTLAPSARCGLVRALFADDAFAQLASYLGPTGCAKFARNPDGRVRVRAFDGSDPSRGTTKSFFARGERCESRRFVLIGQDEVIGGKGEDLFAVSLHVRTEADRYGVGVGVGATNRTMLCGWADVAASLERGTWDLRPAPPDKK